MDKIEIRDIIEYILTFVPVIYDQFALMSTNKSMFDLMEPYRRVRWAIGDVQLSPLEYYMIGRMAEIKQNKIQSINVNVDIINNYKWAMIICKSQFNAVIFNNLTDVRMAKALSYCGRNYVIICHNNQIKSYLAEFQRAKIPLLHVKRAMMKEFADHIGKSNVIINLAVAQSLGKIKYPTIMDTTCISIPTSVSHAISSSKCGKIKICNNLSCPDIKFKKISSMRFVPAIVTREYMLYRGGSISVTYQKFILFGDRDMLINCEFIDTPEEFDNIDMSGRQLAIGIHIDNIRDTNDVRIENVRVENAIFVINTSSCNWIKRDIKKKIEQLQLYTRGERLHIMIIFRKLKPYLQMIKPKCQELRNREFISETAKLAYLASTIYKVPFTEFKMFDFVFFMNRPAANNIDHNEETSAFSAYQLLPFENTHTSSIF